MENLTWDFGVEMEVKEQEQETFENRKLQFFSVEL